MITGDVRIIMMIALSLFVLVPKTIHAIEYAEVVERYGDRIFFGTSDDTERQRRVEAMFREPVNINRASFETLIDIPLITADRAREIIALREKKIIDATYALVDAGILSEDDYAVVKYFITMDNAPGLPAMRIVLEAAADVSLRATNDAAALWKLKDIDALTRGYPFPFPVGIKHRVSVSMPGFAEAYLVSEHDPYERDYFDLVKASVLFHTPVIDTCALGALSLSFGQGLVFSTGRNASSSIDDVISFEKRPRVGIDRGSSEAWLCGIALEKKLMPLSIAVFGGMTRYDARVQSGYFGDTNAYVVSLEEYPAAHVDERSLAERAAATEICAGINADCMFGRLRFGVTAMAGLFSIPIKPSPAPEDRFDLAGQYYGVIGPHWDMAFGPVMLFGEIAVPVVGDIAPADYAPGSSIAYTADIGGILGAVFTPIRSVTYQISARYYGCRMPLLHNRAFADGDARGEYGMYNAFSWRALRMLDLSLFADVYRDIIPQYGETSPASGTDAGLSIVVKPLPGLRCSVRQKARIDEEPGNTNSAIYGSSSMVEVSFGQPIFSLRVKAVLNGTFDAALRSGAGYVLADAALFPAEIFSLSLQGLYFDARSETLTLSEKAIPGEYASASIGGIGWSALAMMRFTFFGSIRVFCKYRIRVNYEMPAAPVADEAAAMMISVTL